MMAQLKVINPATQKVIIEIPISSKKEMLKKVDLAQKTQEKWADFTYQKRATYLKKFNQLAKKNKKSIAEIISKEMGKPISEALVEVNRAIDNTNWFINNVEKEIKPKKLQEQVALLKEPVGVVTAITPWNLPFIIPLWIIPPALLTGNTVVFKPSEISPLTGELIFDLFKKAGLPKGCLNLLIGGDKLGKFLVGSEIDMVAFVGSQNAGKDIMKNSADKLHKLALELGGKDPLIVLKDTDVKKAAHDAVQGSLLNCGQLCASVERIYVEKQIYNAFVEEVMKEVKSYESIGPLTDPTQLKIVQSHIRDAKKKGGKILSGGKKRNGKGYFYPPTLIVNVNHSMKLMTEETFGPIIAIMKVKDEQEAVKFSNCLNYGLCTSIYSKNKKKAKKIASKIQAGTVCINCTPSSHAAYPWGGVKQSGFGRMLSKQGINEFLEPKVVHMA
ncbi:MAG: aldehyde dehydrogenase family protein [Candidatus Altiarchaeota archaeon]